MSLACQKNYIAFFGHFDRPLDSGQPVRHPLVVPDFIDPSPPSAAELIPALDASIAKAKQVLGGMDDATIMATWRMMHGEREVFALPRVALLRSIMLNHWYHHRGQLTVYLRELNIPIPSIYGPSADENPFA